MVNNADSDRRKAAREIVGMVEREKGCEGASGGSGNER
jgi:hypothetical protein